MGRQGKARQGKEGGRNKARTPPAHSTAQRRRPASQLHGANSNKRTALHRRIESERGSPPQPAGKRSSPGSALWGGWIDGWMERMGLTWCWVLVGFLLCCCCCCCCKSKAGKEDNLRGEKVGTAPPPLLFSASHRARSCGPSWMEDVVTTTTVVVARLIPTRRKGADEAV